MSQCVTVCCSVLQHAAVCCATVLCSVLQYNISWCSVVHCAAVFCSVLQCGAVFYSMMQRAAASYSVVQYVVAGCCRMLQCCIMLHQCAGSSSHKISVANEIHKKMHFLQKSADALERLLQGGDDE